VDVRPTQEETIIEKFVRWPRALAHVLASPAGTYLDDLATIWSDKASDRES